MKKIMAMIADHPKLAEELQKLTDLDKNKRERMEFIKKMASDLMESTVKEAAKTWDRVDELLVELKIAPPDYNKKTCNLQHEAELGLLLWYPKGEQKDEKSFMSFLKSLVE